MTRAEWLIRLRDCTGGRRPRAEMAQLLRDWDPWENIYDHDGQDARMDVAREADFARPEFR